MLKRFALFALTIAAPLGVAIAQTPGVYEQLQAHRALVLGGRVFDITTARLKGLSSSACRDIAPTLLPRLQALGTTRPQDETQAAAWIQLYADSKKANAACTKILDRNEKKFFNGERSYFRPLEGMVIPFCAASLPLIGSPRLVIKCVADLQALVKDIDPHCVKASAASLSGHLASNACYAADGLIARGLRAPRDPRLTELKNFTDHFSDAIRTAPVGPTQLDLWDVYLNGRSATPQLREQFLAMMTFGTTSSASSSDHVDGFAEHYWMSALSETNNPESTITEYHRIKTLGDRIDTLLKWARSEKVELKIGTMSLNPINRHDWMAAFLGCHYRKSNALYHSFLPRILGYGYETLDFKSHLQEKWSLKKARTNFKQDTARYRTGSKWGFEFCSK